MYKIYINEVPVTFCSTQNVSKHQANEGSKLFYEYTGKIKGLRKIVQLCEGSDFFDEVILHCIDIEKLKSDFISLHSLVEAAGGLIRNEQNEFLSIYRRGHWDLPKGKMDKGETKREAAIREVKEETGIKSVVILNKINVSYHTFTGRSGKKILKKTHWYLMAAPKQKLVPQKDEDIEMAKWDTLDVLKKRKPIYGNIYQTIMDYEQMTHT